jgi:effector-binding domain-containing protein
MTSFTVETIAPQHTAVVRADVPIAELPAIFDRAFHEVMRTVAAQSLTVTGPPFGFYPRMPTATVEVAAGFPVSAPVAPDGDVTALELPGGRVITGIHIGSYDEMERTYRELIEWAASQGIQLAEGMWESYLNQGPRFNDALCGRCG